MMPIHVVLAHPLYSRNVGNVARAMGNMNGQKLILIDPQCEIDFEARQGAAGSQTHLLELTQYATWADFFKREPEGVRIAFCARSRKDTDPMPLAARVAALDLSAITESQPLYLIFGREDHGLTNEDVEYANFICQLPTYGRFESLNLAHAVLLALYIVRESAARLSGVEQIIAGAQGVASASAADSNAANDKSANLTPVEHFQFPEEVVREWLSTLGFEFGDRRTDVLKVLKRILLANIATAKELRILEAVLNQTVRKLKAFGKVE